MSEMSEEALAAACAEKVKQLEFSVKQSAFDLVRQELETELAIARVALLALRERAEPVVCPKCGNTGLADSGGVQPWGEPILIECDCTAPRAPVVPDEVLKSLDLLFRRSYFRRWVKDPQGYVAGSIPVRDLVNVALFAEACRAAMLATPSGKKE
ncbi:hypothetical protein KHP29_21445 [Cronobacter sakazakii]|uniref:hypothetical protein n=1 Tax=Cronobacter sakazakii TaxID=28141 RepID=UPI001BCCFEB7|nr:hypothetical protein [Cronobacter sakazakii]MBS4469264.1 hypothetical protein [Cronobacter sakazakii]MBS4473798.1 hypothetical protein [Cronobacter sakazakii]MBS4478127.1 hypothetical protein [Cronobacter sakazakii]MBS4482563.1 hypothetical protein [Cronobacter sakazakii]MBS4486908.1 hypothetical protein [Cronobacter sakazakii]